MICVWGAVDEQVQTKVRKLVEHAGCLSARIPPQRARVVVTSCTLLFQISRCYT